jgi:C4-dicarboxylate-specific signal transduction histidine kinase
LVANLNRAADLIQSFKQVAADRNYSDQRSFDLADLTEQVVMSLRPGLRKHNLMLNVDCQPNLVMNSYPGPYGQVLTNLFLNAVSHAFPEGKPGVIDIQARESGRDNVEIIFADNGCGMSAAAPSIRSSPRAATRAAPGLGCTSSTTSSPTGSAAGSISIPSRAPAHASRSSCPASRPWSRRRSRAAG